MRAIARVWQNKGGRAMVYRFRGQIISPSKIERWIKRREGKANSSRVVNDASEGMIFCLVKKEPDENTSSMLTYFHVATLAEILKHLEYWPRDELENGAEEREELSDSSSEDEDFDCAVRRAESSLAQNAVGAPPQTCAITCPCGGDCRIVTKSTDRRSSNLASEEASKDVSENWITSKSTNYQACESQRRISISSPSANQENHWESNKQTRKRSIDDVGSPNERGDDHQTKQKKCIKFSCPYRKRNPAMFNVRTNRTCALISFPNVAELK